MMSKSNHSQSFPFAGCFQSDFKSAETVFLGICDDTQSSYLRGSALAPEKIRTVYNSDSYGPTGELGVDLEQKVIDFGDLLPDTNRKESFSNYTKTIARLLKEDKKVFIAGGDHAITIPVVQAFEVLGFPIQVIQIDAHPDLYPTFNGSAYSHACTAARILEMPHVVSVTQIGIRCLNQIQADFGKKFKDKLSIYEAHRLGTDLSRFVEINTDVPVFLTVDMDGFDPAFAPGVSHPVPGGLTARQVFDLFHNIEWQLIGMDVVETNPKQDVNDLTSLFAARILHEGMGYTSKRSNR